MKGRDGGQVVSVLAFYSEFESRWNLQFCSVKFVIEKNENNQKEAWVGPFFKKKPFHMEGVTKGFAASIAVTSYWGNKKLSSSSSV